MEYTKEKLAALLLKQQWTAEDYKWLAKYIDATDSDELKELMHGQYIEDVPHVKNVEMHFSEGLLQKIHNRIGENVNAGKRFKIKRWIAVAASITGLFFCTYLFYILRSNVSDQNAIVNVQKKDIAPGKNKAILKLSDGSVINLDDSKNSRIAQEGNTDIIKAGGMLAYNKLDNTNPGGSDNSIISNNTLSTPRGGQYQLKLADGTIVWLNSASSLDFPAVFNGKERRVKLTGEAYFEVAKNKKLPFIVEVASSEIKVLGTHFNIRAYSDDIIPVEATLLEGSIKFTHAEKSLLLQPGEQANLEANGAIIWNKNVDTDDVIAWKNGFFHFEKRRIDFIMRELARWYDIEVVYKDPIDASFFAEMPKNTNLSDALKSLQLTGKVKFAVDGNRVTVLRR